MISDKAKEQLAEAVQYINKSYQLQGYLMDAKTLFGDGSRFRDLGFHHFQVVHRTFENHVDSLSTVTLTD